MFVSRAHGNHKHCTKILQDAVNSVSDWPESLFEAYINYEREEGNLWTPGHHLLTLLRHGMAAR